MSITATLQDAATGETLTSTLTKTTRQHKLSLDWKTSYGWEPFRNAAGQTKPLIGKGTRFDTKAAAVVAARRAGAALSEPFWKRVYLTNACCEDVIALPELLEEYGLPYEQGEGVFCPLTAAEAQFISCEDKALDHPDLPILLTGYSVLLAGQKWAAPTLEFMFDEETEASERELAEQARRHAAAKLAPLGGRAETEEEIGDRVSLTLLIPMRRLEQLGAEAWWNLLAELFADFSPVAA